VAASLLIGVGVGALGRGARSADVDHGVIASPTRIIYDTMRGDSTPARIEHATSQSTYVLVEVAVPLGAEHITLAALQPAVGTVPRALACAGVDRAGLISALSA